MIGYLEKHKIQTNVYYHIPLHLQDANKYLGYSQGDLQKTEKLCKEIIALPMYPELAGQAVKNIVMTINRFAGRM
jgi:dTDP-4-amino-4,6-dideoxygalactose transaminase